MLCYVIVAIKVLQSEVVYGLLASWAAFFESLSYIMTHFHSINHLYRLWCEGVMMAHYTGGIKFIPVKMLATLASYSSYGRTLMSCNIILQYIVHNVLYSDALIQQFGSRRPPSRSLVPIVSNLSLFYSTWRHGDCSQTVKWIVFYFFSFLFYKPKHFHLDLIHVSSKTFILVEGLSVEACKSLLHTWKITELTFSHAVSSFSVKTICLIYRNLGLLETPPHCCSLRLYSSHFLSRQQKQTSCLRGWAVCVLEMSMPIIQ